MKSHLTSMGTLGWAEGRGGKLTAFEKAKMLSNLAAVQTREAIDSISSILGLLRPKEIDLATVAPPDTLLTKDAMEFATQTHSVPLLFHSYRTFYFGALIAAHDNTQYDPELLFAAAILHDTALTPSRATALDHCCFAVSGGRQVQAWLTNKQHPQDKVECVANAIALHLNLYVPASKHGPVAALVARGAICDVFTAGLKRIHPKAVQRLLAIYPRGDLYDALTANGAPHAPDSRPDFLSKLGGLPKVNRLDSM